MNTENYVNFTIHSASNTHWTQAIKIIIFRNIIQSLEELNVFSLERTREKRKFPIGVHMPYRFFYCPTDAYGVLLSDTVNIWYLLLNAKEIDR